MRSIQWAYEHGLQWQTIQLGRPMENGYVESFNGRFRGGCLNENGFTDLADAREKITQWKRRPPLAAGLFVLIGTEKRSIC